MAADGPVVTGPLREFLAAPGRTRQLLLAAAALVALAGAFELGQLRAGYNAMEAQLAQRRLEARLAGLEAENRSTRQELARVQTDDKVDRESYAQVESQLAGLQDKIIEQQEELAFYRGIVGGPGQGGLKVQEFTREAGAAGVTRVKFVLAQVEHAEREVRGQLQVRIEGLRGGRLTSLDMASLGAAPRDFSFRYFQEMSADIRLPPDFTPERVVIRVLPATAGVQASVESFPWGAAAGARP